MSNSTELMLIDVSGLAHATFHVSGNEPDPSYISNTIIARVRAIASQHLHAAICCDSGKSFRKDIDPQYKAGRDTENRAVIGHQLGVALDVLKRDGFVVWSVPGFEADDLIATAVTQALAIEDTTVLVVSEDKDLLQLVSDRVTQRKFDGSVRTPADVFDKLGVRPDQVADYLALVGDKSDNIIGCEKIGKTIAPRLLSEHGTLDNLFAAMARGVVPTVTPLMRTNLMEFQKRLPTIRKLIALRTDAPIPFAEIAAERTAAPMMEETSVEQEILGPDSFGGEDVPHAPSAQSLRAEIAARELSQNESLAALSEATQRVAERVNRSGSDAAGVSRPAVHAAERASGSVDLGRRVGPESIAVMPAVSSAPVDFSQQLEPRNMTEAKQLAQLMFDSKLFGSYGAPQAVLAVVLAGRELGIPAMASLRGFHILEGKPQMSADTMAALVMKSGKCKYFRCTERTPTRCSFVTQRLPVEDYPEQALTVTIEEMRAAWRKDDKAWAGSGWGKTPAAMLVAACKRTLARLEYPDVVGNIYDADEVA